MSDEILEERQRSTRKRTRMPIDERMSFTTKNLDEENDEEKGAGVKIGGHVSTSMGLVEAKGWTRGCNQSN